MIAPSIDAPTELTTEPDHVMALQPPASALDERISQGDQQRPERHPDVSSVEPPRILWRSLMLEQ